METIVKDSKSMTEEEAIELANEIERVEKALKEMKNKLRNYVKENGSVNTGERIWDIRQSVSWRVNDAEKLKLLSDYIYLSGKDYWEYLGITTANIRKLGFDEETLSKFATKSVSNRFTGRKAPESN